MRNIVETIEREQLNASVVSVIANTHDAPALAWASQRNINTQVVAHADYGTREAFDAALAQTILACQPDYVLLAGFMRILTPGFVRQFEGRLINIHPSLLPAFPGLHTHQQALDYGVQCHGCTLHFVTAALDDGPVIAQGVVPVVAGDTADSLASRVLEVEHIAYASVVRWLAERRLSLGVDGRVVVVGEPTRVFFANA